MEIFYYITSKGVEERNLVIFSKGEQLRSEGKITWGSPDPVYPPEREHLSKPLGLNGTSVFDGKIQIPNNTSTLPELAKPTQAWPQKASTSIISLFLPLHADHGNLVKDLFMGTEELGTVTVIVWKEKGYEQTSLSGWQVMPSFKSTIRPLHVWPWRICRITSMQKWSMGTTNSYFHATKYQLTRRAAEVTHMLWQGNKLGEMEVVALYETHMWGGVRRVIFISDVSAPSMDLSKIKARIQLHLCFVGKILRASILMGEIPAKSDVEVRETERVGRVTCNAPPLSQWRDLHALLLASCSTLH